MNLVERVKIYVGISQVRVYCQDCGNDLTGKNAVVELRRLKTGEREARVYCLGRMSNEEAFSDEVSVVMLNKYTQRQIQGAVATGAITHYSSLEQKAFE